jgi:hypothetical protein
MRQPLLLALLSLVVPLSVPAAEPPDFQRDVRPVFKAHCAKCHSEKVKKSELNLLTLAGVQKGGESGELLVPGKPGESLLFEMIHDGSMPPEGEKPLSKAQVELIRDWIQRGVSLESTSTEEPLTWDTVTPLLLRRCWMCHGPEYQFGGVDLRSLAKMLKGGDAGPAAISGKPDVSLVVMRVQQKKCPPKADIGEAGIEPMTPEELGLFKKWIRNGTAEGEVEPEDVGLDDPLVTDADRNFWSFQSPKRFPVPTTRNDERAAGAIDAFLLRKLRDADLGFSPEADRRVLARRLAYSLTGLPPEPVLVEQFAADTDLLAWDRLVEKLLASPRYGEKWGRFWLDLAGYADSEGKRSADMIRPWAWRYRDYVIRSFNDDKPYDDFLCEQIAGDELVDWADQDAVNEDVLEKLVATGFLRMAPDGTSADPVNRFPDRLEVMTDELDVLGRSVLGLTLNCARCHSHKYDPIPQRDYYRLIAVFKGAYDEYDWLTPQPFGNQWNKAKRRHMTVSTDEERKRVEALAAPIREKIKDLEAQLKAKGVSKADKANLQKALAKQKSQLPKPGQIRALWDRGRPSPTFVYRRGDETQPAQLVAPGVPSVLSSKSNPYEPAPPDHSSPKTGRRLALANWITHPQHPLTARVFVNRIWQQHFGTGIVESVDNFGRLGTPPSHPDLLDWLAVEFVEHGWSLKHLHRLILSSAAWRQQSLVTEEHLKLDPENRLLSRMPMRRLTAEEVRDSVLAAAGRLNEQPFGTPDQVDIRGDGLVTSKAVGGYWRRSIFVRHRRKEMPTILETFDLPQMNPNCTERKNSTVVSQPLHLFNNRMIYDRAGELAKRVLTLAGTSQRKQVEVAFSLTLNRPPTEFEFRSGLDALAEFSGYREIGTEPDSKSAANLSPEDSALADLCHALLNSAAFLYID